MVFKITVRDIIPKLRICSVSDQLEFREYTNFVVIRGLCHVTLIAFTKSGHTNVTGVRSFRQASYFLRLLSQVIGQPELSRDCPVTFVSSTATGRLRREVKLAGLVDRHYSRRVGQPGDLCLNLQYGHFPSLLIRRPSKKGCVQLFCSGKFNIVGCADLGEIHALWSRLSALTRG